MIPVRLRAPSGHSGLHNGHRTAMRCERVHKCPVRARVGHCWKPGRLLLMFDAQPDWPPLPPHLRVCIGDVEATFKRALGSGSAAVTRPAELFFGKRVARQAFPEVTHPGRFPAHADRGAPYLSCSISSRPFHCRTSGHGGAVLGSNQESGRVPGALRPTARRSGLRPTRTGRSGRR